MDEPTNDLDVETLELLEELLTDYKGTLLLVSHDREFLDNVVSSTLVLEGGGQVGEYVGGYSDWLRQKPVERVTATEASTEPKRETATASPLLDTPSSAIAKRKLNYKETRELEELPKRIETLEADISARTEAMNDSTFFQQDSAAIIKANEALAKLQSELDVAYARWTELDS
jgi:ATP-binding cassette subfamily F protein uup